MARSGASADVVWRMSRTSPRSVWRRGLAVVAIGAALGLVVALGVAQVAHAATLTVTNCSDTGVSGDGSLRGEVLAASNGDTITFALSPSCSLITLASGEILIGKNLTITGPGASLLAVSGNHVSRVFEVSSATTVNLSGLTIENGSSTSGGGIFNNGGTLTVTDSTLFGNSASVNGDTQGGGIYNYVGTLTVTSSTLSGNTGFCFADHCTAAGAIWNSGGGGTVRVTNSTLSGNSASCDHQFCEAAGGGIFSYGGVTVTNSTFSGNSTSCSGPNCGADGAGIWNHGGVTVTSSTLSGNSATCSASGCSAFAGGIRNASGSMTVADTIVANSVGGDCSTLPPSVTDGGHNLADDATCGFTIGSPNFDVIGNPLLGPLANNGGPTHTMAPALSSPAVNQVPNPTTLNSVAVCGPGATDQRAVSRPQLSVGPNCDIGALELALPVAQSMSYPTPQNTPRGKPSGTLQSGVTDANPGASSWTAAGPVFGPNHGSVTVNADGSLIYTPTTGFRGPDRFTFTLADQFGFSSAPALITINVGFYVVTSSIPAASRGMPYSAQFHATGGAAPYRWKLVGKLPKGLKLNKATGAVSGTPRPKDKAQTYTFVVQVKDRSKPHMAASQMINLSLS
jgi:hypothetical protein